VTQQDIICLITNVTDGTNLSLSIPCGYTMNAYCVVGSNNGPAFQAAVNNATSILDSGQATNVVISIPAGTYLMVSSNVLNPNYQMISISDTHPALIISSGGIVLQGESATNTILMGCGAGMNHLVQGSLTWISPAYAPYVPMRDTLIECRGPVANNQFPLVFQNLTMDGGLTNGAQGYNYWTIIQANGEGWDTTHHAVADWDGYISYQMNQVKEFTNCIFQHWRGEICICWTDDITNALNDWENCQFLDGNATADNMYYGQKINNCVFNGVGKVMEYYQNNGWTNSSIMENCLVTNIAEVSGPANVHVDCALTGAVTNRTMPSFTFFNNQFYDNVGMELFSLNAAENIFFISNTFDAAGPAINLTGIGQQPSDGTEVWYMTNIWVVGNSFSCSSPLSIGYSVVEDLMCSNNTGFTVTASIGYATNNILSGNTGPPNGGIYYDLGTGPGSPPQGVIEGGQYFVDEPNNSWSMPGNDSIDGGDYFPTDSIISYGNGPVHLLRNAGGVFHLDDIHAGMNPVGATLQVYAVTWTGLNITNFYTSSLGSGGVRLTITNNAPPVTFYWNGAQWSIQSGNPPISFTASPTNGSANLAVQFKSPSVDSSGATIKSWDWNFGDGTTSTAQSPSHTYTNVTTFYPTLSVMNTSGLSSPGSGPSITTTNPAARFTLSPSNGVARLTVHFISPTTDSGGNKIKSWNWSFGDGSTGTGQNPSHVYTNVGPYYPALTFTNANGLSAMFSAAVTVTNPAVKFTATPTNACPNLTIKFTAPNVDTGGNKITSWLWNFGDGTPTSTAENPTHTYVNVQAYQPTLTVVNASDFSPNSFGPAINVAQPTVQFSPNPGNGVSRFTVAFKSPAVDSTGVSIKSWRWNFGDGTTGTGQNPTHTYTNPATYTPVLTISNSVGDLATASGTINVTNPAVKFTASSTNVCPGLSIEFKAPATDSGGNKITSWSWNFGDGTPISTAENPTHTYTTYQTYTPVLAVANVYGLTPNCSGPAINVVNPSVQFTSTPSKGVSRLTVAFKSPSVDSVGVSIKSWHWNFGDGTSGSGQNPTHIYTNPAAYIPVLTISNAVAYWATNSGSVTVTNPAIKFTASTNTGFSPLTIVFKAPAVDSGNNKVTNWLWNFGDNTTSTAENPTHIYTNIQTYYPSVSSKNVFGLTPTSLGPIIIVKTTGSGVQVSGSSPLLSATLSNGALVLSWPTNASGYTLQSSTNLIPPVSWMNVTSPTVIVNGQNVVTNAVTGPEMFFRLEQ
jgi:PKD repeat protein